MARRFVLSELLLFLSLLLLLLLGRNSIVLYPSNVCFLGQNHLIEFFSIFLDGQLDVV